MKTFFMVKPDGVKRNLIGEVISRVEKEGFQITQVPVKKNGIIDLEKFANSINEKTILVSIMHANNEIGVIQPIKYIGSICKKKSDNISCRCCTICRENTCKC